MTLERRYRDEKINRAYWLSDAMIHVQSYRWRDVDAVAGQLEPDDGREDRERD